ncbi:MAG TPA: sigma-54 dependent transcriptional regulator [Myxococcota bacterium]|nr:sigma-54 dependent transcriptional regulator [Myxococcota bacterium]HRY92699.1 sigma-54 dependent transcriptional regulator [Myxococcota bacterium]
MDEAPKQTVLLVDDERPHLESLERIFQREGYHILMAGSGLQALELLRQHHVHVMLTDLVMPGMGGVELLRACRTVAPETEVILMTAFGTIETAVEAMKEGAYDFITKPLKRVFIVKVVRQALEKQHLLLENRSLRQALNTLRPLDIIGQSPAIVRTLEIIRQAGPSTATVLLTGESGTGKELVARAIHKASPRAERPIVTVNCAALPESILESELFGYERGAFTGADHKREGRFEAAHQGTLFLDEVGEMSPTTQVKLLRVLQESAFERLGSNETVRVDIRLVAATNKNLDREVREGRFREDLYYRLNVIRVEVPPLRQRSGDIPLLANFFLRRYAAKNQRAIEAFTGRAMDALGRYRWPGNVRELENVIERAVVLSQDEVLDLDDLPPHLVDRAESEAEPGVAAPDGRGIYLPVGTPLEEAERLLLLETLRATGGDKSLAAKILGVATRTIYRKLSAMDGEGGVDEGPPGGPDGGPEGAEP